MWSYTIKLGPNQYSFGNRYITDTDKMLDEEFDKFMEAADILYKDLETRNELAILADIDEFVTEHGTAQAEVMLKAIFDKPA